MFYTFNQNNSGGRFIRNSDIDHYVVIEAENEDEATEKATDIGIYFNGCETGHDCECCGDRWYGCETGTEVPSSYSAPLVMADVSSVKDPKKHSVIIHYLDGRVVYTTSDFVGSTRSWPDLALRD
jgi:hypothetical protein